MSILGFITGGQPQRVTIGRIDEDGPSPRLELDAALRLVPSRSVTISKNPVESGADITDHAKLENLVFSLDGFVSEDDMNIFASFVSSIGAGAIGTATGGTGGPFAGFVSTAGSAAILSEATNLALSPDIPPSAGLASQVANRAPGDRDFPRKVHNFLLALQQDRALVSVTSRMQVLTNLIITQYSAPQDIQDGRSLRFSMQLEQIQIVNSATVQVPENILDKAVSASAASKANLGKQATQAASAAQSNNASLAAQLVDSLSGG